MTLPPKFAAQEADQILTTLDPLAHTLQVNASRWGLPEKVAQAMVVDLDTVADKIEAASFSPEQLLARQAKVIAANVAKEQAKKAQVLQRDSDEGYMATFANPMKPIEGDADEKPYMGLYGDDQSSAVHHGKQDASGKPIAPYGQG